MNRQFLPEFLEGRARGAQVGITHGWDLNFPPPDQNVGEVDLSLGPSAPGQMQAAGHGRLQPQSMDNVHAIHDEIPIICPTALSETRKNHLRYLRQFQMTNNNFGVYHGYNNPNEFMEVYGTYSHIDLNADMQLYDLFKNSGMFPFLSPCPKRRRTGPHPFDVPANLPVSRSIKAGESPEREIMPAEATLNCPICLCGLSEETSTKCGHIFCKQCIEKAIVAQRRCPTCRRKLKKNDTIRIYLPRSSK